MDEGEKKIACWIRGGGKRGIGGERKRRRLLYRPGEQAIASSQIGGDSSTAMGNRRLSGSPPSAASAFQYANEASDDHSTTNHGETSLLEASPMATTLQSILSMGLPIPSKPFVALETGNTSFASNYATWKCVEYAIAYLGCWNRDRDENEYSTRTSDTV
jgi:hypothetical protein